MIDISKLLEVLKTQLQQSDWESAAIVAKQIRDRCQEENLLLDDDETNLVVTALAAWCAHTRVHALDSRWPNRTTQMTIKPSDGHPDDSDKDPETGIPYGETT